MRSSRAACSALALPLLGAALVLGCGKDRNSSPGPGGSTIMGSVSNATTASLSKPSRWFAWLREDVLGLARPALAATDTTLGGITVIARGGGRELSDLTDSAGGFQIVDAPTGEVTIIFRRGSCEGSLPIGGVISSSTLTLSGVGFVCNPGSNVGNVTFGSLAERFTGVVRDDPPAQNNLRLCTRVGSDDVLRSISALSASVTDSAGNPTTFSAVTQHDQLLINGFRSGADDNFTYNTQSLTIQERNVTDECAGL